MESAWQVAFVVLQIVFVSILGYFVAGLKRLEGKMENNSRRVDNLETKVAVEFERNMTTRDMIISVEKKIDTLGLKIDRILEPEFFQRCPNIKKGEK